MIYCFDDIPLDEVLSQNPPGLISWYQHGTQELKTAVLAFVQVYASREREISGEEFALIKRYVAEVIRRRRSLFQSKEPLNALLSELDSLAASDLWKFSGKLLSFDIDPF